MDIRQESFSRLVPDTEDEFHEFTPIPVQDVRTLSMVYRTMLRRGLIRHCRSIPLEMFLFVVTSKEVLVCEKTVLLAVEGSHGTKKRWLDLLVEDGVFARHENGMVTYISLAPKAARQFLFDL